MPQDAETQIQSDAPSPNAVAWLAELVGVPVNAIQRWRRRGYLRDTLDQQDATNFDFEETRVAKRLASFLSHGCSLSQIDVVVDQLEQAAGPNVRPLADWPLVIEQGSIFVKREGEVVDPGGQLRFCFDDDSPPDDPAAIYALPETKNFEAASGEAPNDLRRLAVDLDDSGNQRGAIEAYRLLLLTGRGEASDHAALATLLYASGALEAARERYFVSLELDDSLTESRMNLGCVLIELGEHALAVEALAGVVEDRPDSAEAHYYRAQALKSLGREEEAKSHWRRALELAPDCPWSNEARRPPLDNL